MTDEIIKLYENARIEKELAYFECNRGRSSMRCCPVSSDERDKECSSCFFRDKMKEVYEYPPFTAEKQLEIMKFLLKKAVYYDVKDDKYWFYYEECESAGYKPFDEAIAHFINKLWADMLDEEKQQIKEILEWLNLY